MRVLSKYMAIILLAVHMFILVSVFNGVFFLTYSLSLTILAIYGVLVAEYILIEKYNKKMEEDTKNKLLNNTFKISSFIVYTKLVIYTKIYVVVTGLGLTLAILTDNVDMLALLGLAFVGIIILSATALNGIISKKINRLENEAGLLSSSANKDADVVSDETMSDVSDSEKVEDIDNNKEVRNSNPTIDNNNIFESKK